jgi:hypothetical protein
MANRPDPMDSERDRDPLDEDGVRGLAEDEADDMDDEFEDDLIDEADEEE